MTSTTWKNNKYIINWEQFDENVRSRGLSLLKRLDEFPNSILVTGCQRSGTTMLARVLTQSSGMVNYWFSPDDELDAALILSGYVDHNPQGRYCFQTTYINKRYHEYFEHTNGHRIIFILRNPLSVVYSMLYNWKPHALDRLFNFCGIDALSGTQKLFYRNFGMAAIDKLHRACFAYNGKVSQLYDLKRNLKSDQLMIVDYNDIVTNKEIYLPKIYAFAQLEYSHKYLDRIYVKSLQKKDKLSNKEISIISKICLPVYQDLKKFCV